jgi:hypothetical protein
MNPSVWLPPATPFTAQVTAVFEVPVTIALNCSVPKFGTFAANGETTTLTLTTGINVTVTVAEADARGSSSETANTVTCGGVGTVAGAVYNPVAEMVPFAEPPATLHTTLVLNVSVNAAVNCCVWLMTTFAIVGVTETCTTFPAVPLLHPLIKQIAAMATNKDCRRGMGMLPRAARNLRSLPS